MRSGYEAPDIDVTAAQRQVGDQSISIANFISPRTAVGTADASFSFGTHALRPSTGLSGDRYFSTDRTTIYYYSGTAWLYLAGVNSGTDAVRAAITVTANDNGSLFFTTDQNKLWQVSGGAWVDRFVTLDLTTSLKIATNQVVGTRKTGWGAATGTAARTTFATFAGQTITNPPTQAEVQAIDDHVKILSQRLKALIDDLHQTAGHGLLGT